MEKLNKEHLVATYRDIKAENGEEVSNAQAKRDVDDFLQAIIGTLAKHKDAEPNNKNVRVRLQAVNFGAFELRNVPEREHKNPQNPDKKVLKPAHNKVVITLGKEFEEAIN